MSYDVYLAYGEKTAQVERHAEGGTYVMGGTVNAQLNVTYNYAVPFSIADGFSIRDLDQRRARYTVALLQKVVDRLGRIRDRDYWAATPGNAGHAASILLAWAKQHPDAVWSVS